MSSRLRIITGLGNPGPRYDATRHNAGFMLVDSLKESMQAGPWKSWQNIGEYCRVSVGGEDVFLVKPMTYMNESGRMLQSFAGFYKVSPTEILVCFDDMSLECGKIRIRKSGSAGGQRGMSNIITMLGTQEIPRVRIGIGEPRSGQECRDFVLSHFSKEEAKLFARGLDNAQEAVKIILAQGLEAAMNKFN